jgi:DNA polymerase III alpha subunit
MTTRREFLKKTAVIPVAGMLPGSLASVGSPKGNVSPETNLERLRRHCLDRLPDRYEQASFPLAIRRLDYELAISDRLGRVDEFLAVGELTEFAQEEGIPLRLKGSACSSIIPYLLGFSDVDPVRHWLFFERFRDPDGRWAPPFAIRVEEEQLERISRIASLGYGEDFIHGTMSFMSATTMERASWLVVELLQREQGCTVDLRRLPLDDDQVFRLIQCGDTEGIGVLDSDGVRYLLPHLRPTSIEDLVAINTLYTLAIKRGDLLEQYLQRAGETEFPGSENVDILDLLAETRGLILYQEQIMMLLNSIGGIRPADGFDFIKAVFKRKTAKIAEYRGQFLRTAVGDKTDEETAARLFDQITEAAGYASCLCKANYVSEAMMIYQAAYLKAHHRSEFDKVLGKIRGWN